MNFLAYLGQRMREASSYAGLAAMGLAALHVSAAPNQVSAALGVITAVGGLIAVLVPSNAPPPAPPAP